MPNSLNFSMKYSSTGSFVFFKNSPCLYRCINPLDLSDATAFWTFIIYGVTMMTIG